MRITHINTYDENGGAARAAARLHAGLRALGHDSRLFVLRKDSRDSSVIEFRPSTRFTARLARGLKHRLLQIGRRPLAARPPGHSFFSDDRTHYGAELIAQLPASDVLHLHWIAEFIDYADLFFHLPPNPRVIWTLHDMNAFTGGCHWDEGCGKHRGQCADCPQLGNLGPQDYSARSWSRKNKAFAAVPPGAMRIVAPSRWLAGVAQESSLLGRFPVSIIPYGLDTQQFQPRDRQFARSLFRVPPAAKVVLFVADWASEARKGLNLLLEALRGSRDSLDSFVLAIGRGTPEAEMGGRSLAVEYVRDDLTLSLVYSAADVFVVPSLEDNLPNTALESMACGTPVVAFATGGLPDMVREGQTGIIVPPGDVAGLRAAIVALLQQPERRAALAENCRRVAVEEYSLDVQARRYVSLYESFGRETASEGVHSAVRELGSISSRP